MIFTLRFLFPPPLGESEGAVPNDIYPAASIPSPLGESEGAVTNNIYPAASIPFPFGGVGGGRDY